MQDAYVRAYQHLRQFAGRSQFRTWLTRIAVHEALARIRRATRFTPAPGISRESDPMDLLATTASTPEQQATNQELRRLLEDAIARLPEKYRSVFMLREVEEMSIEQVAEILELTEGTVKVRLHRARRALRQIMYERTGPRLRETFPFPAVRCDRVVAGAFHRITLLGP
jgi:RNA polymerase sigma-70 factor (ECF subfamily)